MRSPELHICKKQIASYVLRNSKYFETTKSLAAHVESISLPVRLAPPKSMFLDMQP